MNTMRVLYVTSWLPTPSKSASYPFVVRDLRALAKDHSVTVAYLSNHEKPINVANDIGIISLPFNHRNLKSTIRVSLKIKRIAQDFDIVHSCAANALPPVALARISTPWVHTEHWSGFLHNSITARFYRQFLRFPDHLVAVSSRGLTAIGCGRDKDDKSIIFNIVEPPSVLAPRVWDPNRIRLVSVGSALEAKGAITAVKTVSVLRRRGVDAELTWVGDGPQRNAMLHCAQDLKIQEALNAVGWIPPKEVSAFYNRADMFFLPTKFEVGNVSVAEAQAHGRPVAIGANGGHIDYVNEAWGVLLQNVDDPDYCASQIINLWHKSRDYSAELISDSVRERLGVDRFIEEYNKVYCRVADTGKASN